MIKHVALFLLILLACSSAQNEPIKIGAVLSLTGFASFYGENSKNGIELAVDEINSNGGINGRPIKVIYEDDTTNGQKAATAASKLIEVDGVSALVGGTWDLSLEPIVPIAESAKIVIINPSTGNTKKSSLSPYLFRTWPSIDAQVRAFEFVLESENLSRVVIFRNSGSWALAHKTALEELLKKKNTSLVADFVGPEVDNNDFSTDVTKLKTLNPDAIFFATGPSDAANIVKKLKEQGIIVKLLSSEGSLGESIKSGAVPKRDVEGAYVLNLLPSDLDFIDKYKKKFGKEPGISSDAAYLAMKIIADAQAKTTERIALKDYLVSLPIFDENGDIKKEVSVFVIRNGVAEKV